MHAISVTIAGATHAEFNENFGIFAKSKGFVSLIELQKMAQDRKPAQQEPAAPVVASPPIVPEAEDKFPKSDDLGPSTPPAATTKRGGKKETAAPKTEEPKKLEVEDVLASMRLLAEKVDMDACRTLLQFYKAKKGSEVAADKRGEFIEYAKDFNTFLAHNPEAKAAYKAAQANSEAAKVKS